MSNNERGKMIMNEGYCLSEQSIIVYEHENIIDVLNKIKNLYSNHIVEMKINDVIGCEKRNGYGYGVQFKFYSEEGLNIVRDYVNETYGDRYISRNILKDGSIGNYEVINLQGVN
jgi:hypothetical protein